MDAQTTAVTILGGSALLVLIDTALGVASAVAGGTFKLEFLYAVGRTKGLVLTQIAILLGAGFATPLFNFELLGIEADPFSALAVGLAAPLALSTIASIADNIGKKDVTVPQGIDAAAVVAVGTDTN